MTIETKRLILNPFTPTDGADLYDYLLSQEEVVYYEPYGPYTKETAMQEAANRSNNPAFIAVRLKTEDKLIGNLYFAK